MNTVFLLTARRIQREYSAIREQCAIVAACDAKHAPYLLNAIASFDAKFPDRPRIIVYDIGLSLLARMELHRLPGLEVRPMPAFVAHWRLNWSWKLHALTHDLPRYVLYLDLANFVALRSIAPWFLSIAKNGYFLVANNQVMDDITPSDYWASHALDRAAMAHLPTFGAGIVGFDRESDASTAIESALADVREGLNLGKSADEKSKNYQPDTVRDCRCFRADQTVLNLNFRKVFGAGLHVRRAAMYSGQGASDNHGAQYLWYARRNRHSLTHLMDPRPGFSPVRSLNRAFWSTRITVKESVKAGLDKLRSLRAQR